GFDWLREGYESQEGKEKIKKVGKLMPIAEELGCTMAQLALAWCLANPQVSTVITGASKPEQVEENMASLEIVPKLTAEIMERIEEILDNKPEPETDFR
ncbi:MAG: aldo/keto reductase, partial [Chloroflexota bacterium]